METHNTREVEDLVKDFHDKFPSRNPDVEPKITDWLRTILTEKDAEVEKDRTTLHTSLVAAVEGKKKQIWSEVDEVDYNQALDDTLTIINSIFKG